MDYLDEKDRVKEVNDKNSLVEKQIEDKPYTIILIVLGIACIVFATIMTIDNTLRITKESGTLYIIGIVIILGAYYWQYKDAENIAAVDKKIDDDDGDSYQELRVK